MVAYNHKNKKDIDRNKNQLPMLRKVMKRGVNDSPSIDSNSAVCLRKINYLINNLSSFNIDTFVYSPYKDDLIDVVNDRNSTILRLLNENAELVRHICALDRSHVYRKKKRLELDKKAPVCTIRIIDLSTDNCNDKIENKGEPLINASPNDTHSWTPLGCDFSTINFEEINSSNAVQQLELETIISNAVTSLDTTLEEEPETHSSNFNICEKLLSGSYVCEENYLNSLAYEVSMIGGSDTPIILDSWLNEAAEEITAPYSIIELKTIK